MGLADKMCAAVILTKTQAGEIKAGFCFFRFFYVGGGNFADEPRDFVAVFHAVNPTGLGVDKIKLFFPPGVQKKGNMAVFR